MDLIIKAMTNKIKALERYEVVLDVLVMETLVVEASNEKEAIEEAMVKSNFGRDGEMSVYSIQKLPNGQIKYK